MTFGEWLALAGTVMTIGGFFISLDKYLSAKLSARSQEMDRAHDDVRDTLKLALENDIFRQYLFPERTREDLFCQLVFNQIHARYCAARAGRWRRKEWQAIQADVRRRVRLPQIQQSWNNIKADYAEDFVEFIDDMLV